jgi:hypothetical protein
MTTSRAGATPQYRFDPEPIFALSLPLSREQGAGSARRSGAAARTRVEWAGVRSARSAIAFGGGNAGTDAAFVTLDCPHVRHLRIRRPR